MVKLYLQKWDGKAGFLTTEGKVVKTRKRASKSGGKLWSEALVKTPLGEFWTSKVIEASTTYRQANRGYRARYGGAFTVGDTVTLCWRAEKRKDGSLIWQQIGELPVANLQEEILSREVYSKIRPLDKNGTLWRQHE